MYMPNTKTKTDVQTVIIKVCIDGSDKFTMGSLNESTMYIKGFTDTTCLNFPDNISKG